MEDCNFENILANFHSGNYKTLLRVPKEVRAKFWEVECLVFIIDCDRHQLYGISLNCQRFR